MLTNLDISTIKHGAHQQDENLTQTAVLNQAAQAEQVTRMAEHLQDGSQICRHTAINIRWREIGERDRKNCGRRVRIMPKYSSASSQPIMASPSPRSTCRKPAITSSSRLGDLLQLSLTWSHSPCPAHGQEVHRRLLLDGTSSEMLSIVVLCQLPDCLQDIRYKASVST